MLTPDLNVRAAVAEDWPALKDLLVRFHGENGLAPLNLDKVRVLALQQIDLGLVILAEVKGELVGGVGLVEESWWYSDERLLRDFFLYVTPEARGSAAFDELKKTAEGIAEGFEIPCFLTVLNHERAGKRGRIASLQGWMPAGYVVRLGQRAGLNL